MSRTRINPRLAKLNYSYTVEEIARLIGVHKNTVRAWLSSGLASLDRQRPILVLGRDLRAFLEKRRSGSKRPCAPGTMYCFKCKIPRRPALGLVEYVSLAPGSGNLRAFCETCETVMHRRCRRMALSLAMPGLEVSLVEGPLRISQSSAPSCNSD